MRRIQEMSFILNYDSSSKRVVELSKEETQMIFTDSLEIKIIGSDACSNGAVRTVDLSSTRVETILDTAFGGCTSLSQISFPSTLRIIQYNAFYNTALTIINIPASVQTMNGYVWNQSPKIEAFIVDDSNPYFSSYNGFLFNKDKTTLYCAPRNIQYSTDIPFIDSLSIIDEYALTSTHLITFVATKSITEIRTRVFHSISPLVRVDLSLASIQSIPERLFNGCGGMTTLILPTNLQTMETNSISTMSALRFVYIFPYLKTIEQNCFTNCPSLLLIYYFGNTDFSTIQMFTGTTNKNNIRVYVTFIYPADLLGTIPVEIKKFGLLKTCRMHSISLNRVFPPFIICLLK